MGWARCCALLAVAACGRVGFDANEQTPGIDPPQEPVAPGDPPPDLVGDGSSILAVTYNTSEGLIHLHTSPETVTPDPMLPFAEIEGSSECGPSGVAKFANLRDLGDTLVFGIKCSLDRDGRVDVGFVRGPIPNGLSRYVDLGGYFSIDTRISALSEIVIADFDGDGTLDLAGGQPGDSTVRVIFDLAARFTATTTETIIVGSAGMELGGSLAAFDVDGDDKPELVIGAPGASSVFVIANPIPTGTVDITTASALQLAGPGQFGAGLAVWDADVDGIADLVVTSPSGDGMAQIYHQPLAAPFVTIAGLNGDQLGSSIDASGDLDGDGNRDLLLGAAGTASGAGSIAAFLAAPGFASRAASAAAIRYVGDWAPMPWSRAAFVGDLDGDGRSEVAVTAPEAGIMTLHTTAGGMAPTGSAMTTARWVSAGGGSGARIVPRR